MLLLLLVYLSIFVKSEVPGDPELDGFQSSNRIRYIQNLNESSTTFEIMKNLGYDPVIVYINASSLLQCDPLRY